MNYNNDTEPAGIIDFDNEEIKAFDPNFTNSLHDCEDIIENREALVRLYRYFKLIITFYPDFFMCSSYEKYKKAFHPRASLSGWPHSFMLPKKERDKYGFDFWGMIKRFF